MFIDYEKLGYSNDDIKLLEPRDMLFIKPEKIESLLINKIKDDKLEDYKWNLK